MNPQRRPLTPKEIKFINGVAEGKTKQQSAIDVYNTSTPGSASSLASEILKKPSVQEALVEAFKRHGITIDAATKPIADGFRAKKDNGAEDHATRLKASSMAFDLMGIGKQQGDVTINFINHAREQQEIYDL